MKFEKMNNEETSLSYEQAEIVRDLLGTDEQIYKNVKNALDALARNQEGSLKIGSPAFYNSFIKYRGKGVLAKEYGFCKSVIDKFVVIVSNDDKQQRQIKEDKEDLLKEVDEYHDSLEKEKLAEERSVLINREASLYGGEEYINR